MNTMNPQEEPEYRYPPLTPEEKVIARAELERRAAMERSADQWEEELKQGLVTDDTDPNWGLEEDLPPEVLKEGEETLRRLAAMPPQVMDIEKYRAETPVSLRPDLESYLED